MAFSSVVDEMLRIHKQRQRLRQLYLTAETKTPKSDIVKAALECNLELLESCITRGDVDVTDNNGFTALMTAAYKNHVEAVRILLENGANARKVTYQGERPTNALIVAIAQDNDVVVSMLLDHGEDPNCTVWQKNFPCSVLLTAIDQRAVRSVATLLRRNVDVTKDSNDLSAMHRLCLMMTEKDSVSLNMLKLLVNSNGATVNLKGYRGLTPLHLAASSGCVDAVRILVEAGASVSVQSDRGQSPVQYSKTGHNDVQRYLLSCEGPVKLVTTRKQDNERSGCKPLVHSGARLVSCAVGDEIFTRKECIRNQAFTLDEICPQLTISPDALEKDTFIAIHETGTPPALEIGEGFFQTFRKRVWAKAALEYDKKKKQQKQKDDDFKQQTEDSEEFVYRTQFHVLECITPACHDKSDLSRITFIVSPFITVVAQREVELKTNAVLLLPHSIILNGPSEQERTPTERVCIRVQYQNLKGEDDIQCLSDWKAIDSRDMEQHEKSVSVSLRHFSAASVFVATCEYQHCPHISPPCRKIDFCVVGSQYFSRVMQLKLACYTNAASIAETIRQIDSETDEQLVKWSSQPKSANVRVDADIMVKMLVSSDSCRIQPEQQGIRIRSHHNCSHYYLPFLVLVSNDDPCRVDCVCSIEVPGYDKTIELQFSTPTLQKSILDRRTLEEASSASSAGKKEKGISKSPSSQGEERDTAKMPQRFVYKLTGPTSFSTASLFPLSEMMTLRSCTDFENTIEPAADSCQDTYDVRKFLDRVITQEIADVVIQVGADRWRELGYALGYKTIEIENLIESQNIVENSEKLRIIIDDWRKCQRGFATLTELLKACDDKTVNIRKAVEDELAKTVQKYYIPMHATVKTVNRQFDDVIFVDD